MKTTLRLLSMLIAFVMLALSVCTPLYAVTAVSPISDGSAHNTQSLESVTESEAVFEEFQGLETVVSERLSSSELEFAVLDLADVPAAMADSMASVEKKDHVKRLFSEEKGLYSVVFQNRDDTTTEYIFSRPVKYIDENGNIRDKSTDIRVKSDKSGYAADDNTVRSYFSSKLSKGVSVEFGEYTIEFYPNSYESKGSTLASSTLPGDRTARERVSYVISPEINICYTPTLDGLKEDIIINEYTGINSFTFTYVTDGLSMSVNSLGEVELKDERGKIVGKLDRIVCYDSNGKTSYGSVSVSEVTPNEEYTVTVSASVDFLTSPTTLYPISIDPSIDVYNVDTDYNTSENYCFIESILLCNDQETVDWYSGSTYVPVGTGEYDISGDITRMIYRFSADFYLGIYSYLPYELESKTIHSAELVVQTYVGDVNRTIYAVPWYGEWPEDTDGDGLVYCSDSMEFDNYDDMCGDATLLSAEFAGEKSYNITQALTEMFYNFSRGRNGAATAIMFYNSNERTDGDGDYVEIPLGSAPGAPSNFRISIDYSNFSTTDNYIISRDSGKFLHYGTSLMTDIYSVASASSLDRWMLMYLGNDTYRIYSGGKYLTANGNSATMSNFVNADTQKWYIPEGDRGIKNVSTGTYLKLTSSGLALAPFVTGDNTFSWKICHNTEYIPVTDFYLEDDWIPVGESKELKIKTLPAGATNVIGNTSYTWSVNSTAFSITQGVSSTVSASTAPGTATLTVKYNPTGQTKTFRIYRGAIREGTYMIRNRGTGRYMDVEGSSTASGAYIQQWNYHTGDYAKWNIFMVSNGDYAIQSVGSQLYLRVEGGTSAANAKIIQFENYSWTSCRWKIEATSNGAFKIVPMLASSLAVSVPLATNANGTDLVQIAYTNNTNYWDEWFIDDGDYNEDKNIVSGAVYSIINKNSGKHVAINPSNLLDGSDVIQKSEVEAEGSMLWQINHIGNGEYKIMNLAAERLLSIDGSWSTEGADSQIWHDDGTTGQIFKIRENDDNTYSFLTKCSGFTKALTVTGASTAENTVLEHTTYTGSASQKFDLESNYVMLYICASEMNSSNLSAGSTFGHSWIEITNLTNENIEFGHYTIYVGEHISIGLFGTDVTIKGVEIPQKGIWYNRESYACNYEDKYLNYTRIGTLVSTINLRVASVYTRVISNENNDGQWDIIEDYNGLLYNCVHFALEVWNESVTESYKLYSGMVCQTYTIALGYYFLQLNTNSLIDALTVSPTDLKDAIRMQFSSEYESVNCLFVANTVSYHNGEALITYPIE